LVTQKKWFYQVLCILPGMMFAFRACILYDWDGLQGVILDIYIGELIFLLSLENNGRRLIG